MPYLWDYDLEEIKKAKSPRTKIFLEVKQERFELLLSRLLLLEIERKLSEFRKQRLHSSKA